MSACFASLGLTDDGDTDPETTRKPSNSSVRRLEPTRRTRDAQAETTIDYTQRDCDSAIPDMEIGPDLSLAKLLELRMMDETQDGLDEQRGQDDETDYGVIVDGRDVQLSMPSVSKPHHKCR